MEKAKALILFSEEKKAKELLKKIRKIGHEGEIISPQYNFSFLEGKKAIILLDSKLSYKVDIDDLMDKAWQNGIRSAVLKGDFPILNESLKLLLDF